MKDIKEQVINKVEDVTAKNEYFEDQLRHKIDYDRNVQSAVQTFQYMSNHQLQVLTVNFSYSQHGRDPRIADALIAELQKRELNELLTTLKNYLSKIEYKKPWLRKE